MLWGRTPAAACRAHPSKMVQTLGVGASLLRMIARVGILQAADMPSLGCARLQC